MGLPRGPLAAFLVFFLPLPASSSAGASLAPDEMSASSAPGRRERLPVGRAGCVDTAPVPSGSWLAACLSSVLCVVTYQCPHLSSIRLQQGRQDLNLQPAVLETAALPVELRPFSDGTAGRPSIPSGTHTIRALPDRPIINRRTARRIGKIPRSECTAGQV